MKVRITKARVAMATLFVLAGVGLASLLSPLVGTALATAGQIVNISDRSGSAYFAKVDSAGKLAVGDGGGSLTVDGKVADANLSTAFRASGEVGSGTCVAIATAPSGKAIVLTSIDINAFSITSSTDAFVRSRIGPVQLHRAVPHRPRLHRARRAPTHVQPRARHPRRSVADHGRHQHDRQRAGYGLHRPLLRRTARYGTRAGHERPATMKHRRFYGG